MTPNFLREGVWQAAHAAHVLPCHAGVNGLGDTSRGMRAGVLAITDKGFAKAVKELAEAVTEEKEEHAHDD